MNTEYIHNSLVVSWVDTDFIFTFVVDCDQYEFTRSIWWRLPIHPVQTKYSCNCYKFNVQTEHINMVRSCRNVVQTSVINGVTPGMTPHHIYVYITMSLEERCKEESFLIKF